MKKEIDCILAKFNEPDRMYLQTRLCLTKEKVTFKEMSQDDVEKIIVSILSEMDPSLSWIKKLFSKAK